MRADADYPCCAHCREIEELPESAQGHLAPCVWTDCPGSVKS